MSGGSKQSSYAPRYVGAIRESPLHLRGAGDSRIAPTLLYLGNTDGINRSEA